MVLVEGEYEDRNPHSKHLEKKLRKRYLLREAGELRFEENNIDEYGIPRDRLCRILMARFWTTSIALGLCFR